MATGDIKTFTINQGGFTLAIEAIDLGGGQTQFNITSVAGQGDLNAIWWSDGDAIKDGNTTLAKSDSSLNMEGTKVTWDGYMKLSDTGLGKAGEAKDTFLSQGETLSFTATVDWSELDTIGIRATSVNGNGSIKGLDDEPDAVISFPTVTIDNVEVTEGTTAVVEGSLGSSYPYDVTVSFTVGGGSAISGDDYTPPTTLSVTIPANTTTFSIPIDTIDDAAVEPTETFVVTLTGAVPDLPGNTDPTVVLTDTATVTILDNDVETPPAAVWGPTLSGAALPQNYTGQQTGQAPDPNDNNNDSLTGGTNTNFGAGTTNLTSGDDTQTDTSAGGNRTINGLDGNDTIYAGVNSDTINGGNGNDALYGQAGNDTINGDAGNDTIYGGTGNDAIDSGTGNDLIYGGQGNDVINGGADDDTIYGGSGNDTITGGTGADEIYGGYGADTINLGPDDGSTDTVHYLSILDTNDTINGFVPGQDKLDLSAIDADTSDADNDAFVWAGQAPGNVPQVQANSVSWYTNGSDVIVLADTDGDTATAEFKITLTGITSISDTDFNTL